MLAELDAIDGNDPVSRLRAFIAAGSYKAGDRLPAERDLTDQLGMTRSMLRKALDSLERDGAIWRHVGKGTFVASRGLDHVAASTGGSLVELGRQLTPFRMMRARLAIEPAIAKEAAINASGAALMQMNVAMERAHSVSNWQDYEIQDDIFHRAIAEGSDNLLLLALFDQLNVVRRAVAWGSVIRQSVKPAADHSSFREHEAITAAISRRDPDAAYEAMRNHLRSVSARLFEGA
ncbi:GntR family transcriptional regulator [Hoeflea marina]|uniref:GntR family transcriptional regulator n=1 Tax=Hoeflea marina TaxID=274592 RepID=A0A317PIR8_9HYPH|nr:FCD domain-containing protein [Hoeflea marina]PWW00343.1 GntR family transcriptional regulator [Hoeflea marina]